MQKINNIASPSQNYYGSSEFKEFNVGFIPHKSGTYRIEIDDVIHEVAQFSTAIQVLEAAKEDDEIEILLQTDGGNMNATDGLLHAMRKCCAPIHVIATGGVHSAGTYILLEADSFELSDSFCSLLHCGGDGAIGNANEYRAKSSFDLEFRTRKFREGYEGFLTEKEITDMLDGKDIWLDGKGWYERSLKRMEYFSKKHEAMEKEAQKASRPKRVKPKAVKSDTVPTPAA